MSEEEIKKLLEGAFVKFVSYYKYMFYFSGELNGLKILCGEGGDSDSIYRLSVDLSPFLFSTHSWDYIQIQNEKGEIIFERE